MEVFTTDRIRNVVIMGHGGAGKTSLVEAFANLAGITTRLGKIDDGNTISDYDKEEQRRKFSIHTSVVPIIWDNCKVNFFDTPGYFDFVGEVEEAVAAAAGSGSLVLQVPCGFAATCRPSDRCTCCSNVACGYVRWSVASYHWSTTTVGGEGCQSAK